jgi:hypothetical protein
MKLEIEICIYSYIFIYIYTYIYTYILTKYMYILIVYINMCILYNITGPSMSVSLGTTIFLYGSNSGHPAKFIEASVHHS